MAIKQMEKRDGRVVKFDRKKITQAILNAAAKSGGNNKDIAEYLSLEVVDRLDRTFKTTFKADEIQDAIEKTLIENGHAKTAKEFILYRANRSKLREMDSKLMRTFEELTMYDTDEAEVKRENANIDGDSSMGTMLRYGSEAAKKFNLLFMMDDVQADAHRNGDIHVHDLDFMALTETCVQIDLDKLFKDGFNTGHGFLREPSEIRSYAALACIAIQSSQNDMHGGQSIPNFDYYMAPGVAKTLCKEIYDIIDIIYPECVNGDYDETEDKKLTNLGVKHKLQAFQKKNTLIMDRIDYIKRVLKNKYCKKLTDKEIKHIIDKAIDKTNDATHQAMEALVHNLNSMHSRAGGIYAPEYCESYSVGN